MPEKKSKVVEKEGPDMVGQWQLKIADGSVYGPIDLATLKDWAEQGRIAPGDEISQDKEKWSKAEELGDLAMQWVIDVGDGSTYGPVNIHAIVDLVQDGTVKRQANASNNSTGETVTISDLLPELADIVPSEDKKESATSAEQEILEQIEGLEQKAKISGFELERARQELEAQQNSYAKLQQQTVERETKLRADIETLEKEIESARSSAKSGADAEDLKGELENLQQEMKRAADMAEQLKNDLKHQKELYEAERERAARLEETHREHVHVLEKKCEATAASLEQAEERLATERSKGEGVDWLGGEESMGRAIAADKERVSAIEKEVGVTVAMLEEARADLEKQKGLYRSLENVSEQKERSINDRIEQYHADSVKAAKKIKELKAKAEGERRQREEAGKGHSKKEQKLLDRIGALDAEMQEAESGLRQARHDLKVQKDEETAEKKKGLARESELTKRISELESEWKKATEALKAAEKEQAEKTKVLENKLAEQQAELDRAREEFEAEKRRYQELSAETSTKEVELSSLKKSSDALKAAEKEQAEKAR
ncbi:MAG: hypothetical protein E4H02_08010, partial [Lentisphaerales bacterium]